ncbi:unnamed protein product [Rotaria sordida]|uniref:Uncharacterized protein n=1 Tax=Rotaria sordida TaxID=392033 RepID=A0A814F6W0_9BILA|nr:unnamed protein product [Rotaria sordida]
MIERIIPVASEIEKRKFSHVLSKKAYHSISDNHLWFSIFSRPASNKFTRVQRCTCCFVLLFTSMLLNIMYYDLSTEAKSSKKTHGSILSIGPLHITPEQIGIGIMVELLSLIPSLLIVQFFRRIRTRQQISAIYKTLYTIKPFLQISALFFAYCIRTSHEDEEANEYIDDNGIDLNNNEDYLHSIEYDSLYNFQSRKPVNRLNENELANARQYRLKEIQKWSIIREFFIYLTFLTLICIIAYSNRDYNSFLQVHHLRKYFLNSRQINYDYTKISTINEYWKWLENSFVSNLRAQQWYNGDTPRNLNGYINDKSNRIIGWSIMR